MGGWGHTFLKKAPGIFKFVTLPLEICDKVVLHPWKFHKIVLHPLEFPRPKTKTLGNSTIFSWSPLKILLFYWPLEFPHSIFSIPLEIPCPQPPVGFPSQIAQYQSDTFYLFLLITSTWTYSMYLFLQEDDDICFIAIETRFLGEKSVLEKVFKGKILSNRVKIWQFSGQITWN